MSLDDGGMLAGRYRVEGPLDAGGQGRVLAAVDTWCADRPVALKQVGADAVDSLRAEFAALSALRHPALVEALDLFVAAEGAFLVEPRIEGKPLDTWGRARTAAELFAAVAPIALALAHLHVRGLVHLDASPHNILVRPAGKAVLVDLGLARPSGTAGAAGTPGFVPPEILAGEPATGAADVYTLAASILYTMAGADPAWTGPHPETLGSSRADCLLAECLRDAPASRPGALQLARTMASIGGLDAAPFLRPLTRLPLCGREQELADFESFLARDDAVYVVSGASGVGKSAFLSACADRARLSGLLVLEGSATQPRSLERLLGQVVAVAPAESSLFHALGAELADLVPHARLPTPAGIMRAGSERAQLLVLAVDALSRARPVLLALDDAEEPLEPIATALRIWRERPPQVGVRLLIAGRLSGSESGVRLSPLDHAGVAEMLRAGFAEPRPAAEAERILDRCGGLPGEIMRTLELVAALDTSVLDLPAPAAFSYQAALPPALAPLALPSEPVPEAVVRRIVAAQADGTAALQEALARGALRIEAGAAGPVFCVCEAARQAPATDKSGWAVLARAYEECGSHLAAAGAWAWAGEVGRAVELAEREREPADEVRRTLGSIAEAAGTECLPVATLERWARMASEAADREALQRAAPALARHGRAELAATLLAACDVKLGSYEQALAALPDSKSAEAAAVRARALLFSGRAREAAEVASRAVEEASGAARADLLDVLGHGALRLGDAAAAARTLERALAEAEEEGELRGLGRARHALAIVLQRQGRLPRALELYRAALEGADTLAATARTASLATLLQDMGELNEARECYAEVLSRALALGNAREQAIIGVNLANLEVQVGNLQAAVELARETYERCRAQHLEHPAAVASLVLAEAHLERQEVGEATAALGRASELLATVEDRVSSAETALLRARIAAARGERTALAHLEHVDSALAQHLPRQLAYIRARLALSVGGLSDVELCAEAEQAVALAREANDRELLWRALVVLHRAQERTGHREAAKSRAEAQAELDAFLARLPRPLQVSYLSCESRRELARWARQAEPAAGSGRPGSTAYRRLLDINRRMAREHEVAPLLELIVDAAIELLGAERGFLILQGKEGVVIAVARHFDRRALEDGSQRISRSIASEVLRRGEAVLTTNAQEDVRFAGISSVAALRVRSVICVPLRGAVRDDDPTMGALYLDHRFQERAFTEDDVALCESFADQAAIALENARLLEQTREQERRLVGQNERLARLNEQLQQEAAAYAEEAEAALRRLREEGPTVGVGRGFAGIVGKSDKLREALRLVDRFADTDVPVFVQGESGSGKELVARAIHQRSSRASRPFVCINCGAVPETLIESELFGYKRGAFTGATRDKQGLIEASSGGTLFLDEVGEMPMSMQVKLLRVLQEGEVRPVGSTASLRADVRVVSASHADLEELIAQGRFREDFFYRLRVVEIRMPPLRERREDIPLLVNHFCRAIAGVSAEERFTREALGRLLGHDWPGNVRELENEVRRALALAEGRVGLEDLSEHFQAARAGGAAILAEVSRGSLKEILDGFERQVLLASLKRTGWNVRQAAQELGVSRAALYTRLNRFNIVREPVPA